jgi:SAM-dependent methyltransferase
LHNWLVQQIHDERLTNAIKRYAGGVLVDLGCGASPYRTLTTGHVTAHIGIDHPGTPHGGRGIDLYAPAYATALGSATVDTVLCTMVLEHLEDPQAALIEIARILKPGGTLILSAPLYWHLHEAPRDFFRYTEYGLRHLAATAHLDPVEIIPLAGFVVTFAQELSYFLNRWKRGRRERPIALAQWGIQQVAYQLHRYDHSTAFTWAYLAIFRKAPSSHE